MVNREKQGPLFCPPVSTLPFLPHLFLLGLPVSKWEQGLPFSINQ